MEQVRILVLFENIDIIMISMFPLLHIDVNFIDLSIFQSMIESIILTPYSDTP